MNKPRALPGNASRRMSLQRTHDTAPEILLRRELHRRGLRYYVHRRPIPDLRREADLVFPRRQLAVFVDGCFWHGCPVHGTEPRTNASFWSDKIELNRVRDADTNARLAAAGWTVLRVWEHESPMVAADRIEQTYRTRSS